MTNQLYDGATAEQLRHSLVREFLGVHNMFRNYIEEMLRYVDDLVAGQPAMSKPEITARYRALSQAAYQYTQLLHFHHNDESSMLFPALRKEGLDPAIIDRLEADHEEIAGLITKLDSHMTNVAAMDARLVDVDMRRLAEGLRAHLAYEESHVCPLLTHFTHWPMTH